MLWKYVTDNLFRNDFALTVTICCFVNLGFYFIALACFTDAFCTWENRLRFVQVSYRRESKLPCDAFTSELNGYQNRMRNVSIFQCLIQLSKCKIQHELKELLSWWNTPSSDRISCTFPLTSPTRPSCLLWFQTWTWTRCLVRNESVAKLLIK